MSRKMNHGEIRASTIVNRMTAMKRTSLQSFRSMPRPLSPPKGKALATETHLVRASRRTQRPTPPGTMRASPLTAMMMGKAEGRTSHTSNVHGLLRRERIRMNATASRKQPPTTDAILRAGIQARSAMPRPPFPRQSKCLPVTPSTDHGQKTVWCGLNAIYSVRSPASRI